MGLLLHFGPQPAFRKLVDTEKRSSRQVRPGDRTLGSGHDSNMNGNADEANAADRSSRRDGSSSTSPDEVS